MSEEALSYLWQNAMDRFLAEGAVYRELRDLQQRIARYEDWRSAWAEVGRATEETPNGLVNPIVHKPLPVISWRSFLIVWLSPSF